MDEVFRDEYGAELESKLDRTLVNIQEVFINEGDGPEKVKVTE